MPRYRQTKRHTQPTSISQTVTVVS